MRYVVFYCDPFVLEGVVPEYRISEWNEVLSEPS